MDVRQATAGLLDAWEKVGPDDWARPVRHRDSTVAATVYTGWRELEVHTADLGLSSTRNPYQTVVMKAHLRVS